MPYRFNRILVVVDGSEPSKRALDAALSLCTVIGSGLTVLGVQGRLPAYAATIGEVDETKREKDQRFKGVVEDARAVAAELDVEVGAELVSGPPVTSIIRYARSHSYDLIVVGSATRSRRHVLPGRAIDRVARHAHCPVMVVR